LIDEARTPLIISGPAQESSQSPPRNPSCEMPPKTAARRAG